MLGPWEVEFYIDVVLGRPLSSKPLIGCPNKLEELKVHLEELLKRGISGHALLHGEAWYDL